MIDFLFKNTFSNNFTQTDHHLLENLEKNDFALSDEHIPIYKTE